MYTIFLHSLSRHIFNFIIEYLECNMYIIKTISVYMESLEMETH